MLPTPDDVLLRTIKKALSELFCPLGIDQAGELVCVFFRCLGCKKRG